MSIIFASLIFACYSIPRSHTSSSDIDDLRSALSVHCYLNIHLLLPSHQNVTEGDVLMPRAESVPSYDLLVVFDVI